MYFNVKTVICNRQGVPFRGPKPGEKPTLKPDPKTGEPTEFAEDQKEDTTFGGTALAALDSSFQSDAKLAESDPTKWVKSIVAREEIASEIAATLADADSDGWVEFSKDQGDIVKERVSQFATLTTLAQVGPIVMALEKAPNKRPALAVVALQAAE